MTVNDIVMPTMAFAMCATARSDDVDGDGTSSTPMRATTTSWMPTQMMDLGVCELAEACDDICDDDSTINDTGVIGMTITECLGEVDDVLAKQSILN